MILSFFLLLLKVFLCNAAVTNRHLKLKQVLIFSRHNIRTPLGPKLFKYSSRKWPEIYEAPGLLTRKGAVLEGYMGEYFSEWFKSEQFLQEKCPSKENVYVFANSVNRTIETAEAFIESAFRGCNVTINHKITRNKEEMDPIFEPIVRNSTDAFKMSVTEEITRLLDNVKLKEGLSELNKILDIKNSDVCLTNSICDLTDISKNKILIEVGNEITIDGPLYIGSTVTDAFKMNYYNGLPIEDVAWGLVKTPDVWETISEVVRQDTYIKFGKFANYIGAPMIEYLTTTLLKFDDMPKLMLIVGHDFNQIPIFYGMDFKAIRFPNQFEDFPIGGKIVFQRWTDNKNDYLKIEYIYASWSQLRNGTKFSADDSPQRVLLELNWCEVDYQGFCPWNEFVVKLQDRK